MLKGILQLIMVNSFVWVSWAHFIEMTLHNPYQFAHFIIQFHYIYVTIFIMRSQLQIGHRFYQFIFYIAALGLHLLV